MRCGDYLGNAGTAVVVCDRQSTELVHVETSQNCWFRKWALGCRKRCTYVWGKKDRKNWKENQSCKELKWEKPEKS